MAIAPMPNSVPTPSFSTALKFWAKLGVISFGGPAGQIAILHKEVVEKRGWISEQQFLRALNFCMLLPGPEAQQLVTYVGWRLHGTAGGIVAGSLFVIPSIFIMLFLSWISVEHIDIPAIAAALYGIQAAVVAIVVEAVIRIGRRALGHWALYVFPAVAFAAIRFGLPFPAIVIITALGGLLMQHWYPSVFYSNGAHTNEGIERTNSHLGSEYFLMKKPSVAHIGKVFLVCFLLWLAVVGPFWGWRGLQDVLVQEALFFTKAAFITFGGAYAVLTYISDVAVGNGWLSAEQMVTGLGLAETTPGPLIMVTQYVGFLGAWKFHGEYSPALYGVLGGLVTTYVTFLPCFFFIFAGARYIEALAGQHRLQAAMTGVTAGVVGVILNLALWFGYKVIVLPDDGVDYFAVAWAAISFILLKKVGMPVHFLVLLSAAAGMVWRLVFRM